MRKPSFAAVIGMAVLISAIFASSLVAGAQRTTRFEYLQLSPGVPVLGGNAKRFGYRACIATGQDWNCREFESEKSLDHSLQLALSSLGNDGWELVAVMNDAPNPWGDPQLKAYLFKRQIP